MKTKFNVRHLALGLMLVASPAANAAVSVTIDPAAPWQGFMNVFELPSNGGAYVFGSTWGTSDLVAVFSGATLTVAPNTIGDPDPFWYIGGGAPGAAGNKIMDANMYVELNGGLGGQTISFSGIVTSNTLTSAHVTRAFIKDFAPDYSSFNQTSLILSGTGPFSISMSPINDNARHVQYGFETIGVNVWSTDVAPYGNIQLTAIPETSGSALASLAAGLILMRRRRL